MSDAGSGRNRGPRIGGFPFGRFSDLPDPTNGSDRASIGDPMPASFGIGRTHAPGGVALRLRTGSDRPRLDAQAIFGGLGLASSASSIRFEGRRMSRRQLGRVPRRHAHPHLAVARLGIVHRRRSRPGSRCRRSFVQTIRLARASPVRAASAADGSWATSSQSRGDEPRDDGGKVPLQGTRTSASRGVRRMGAPIPQVPAARFARRAASTWGCSIAGPSGLATVVLPSACSAPVVVVPKNDAPSNVRHTMPRSAGLFAKLG